MKRDYRYGLRFQPWLMGFSLHCFTLSEFMLMMTYSLTVIFCASPILKTLISRLI